MQNLFSVLCYVSLRVAMDCHAATVTFDSLKDSDVVTNQFPNMAFQNAVVLTAGLSLNEFEFPPFSGFNVVSSDNGGPITILLASPITTFGGYFTYLVPITLRAFNGANTEVASTASLFSNNLALSGVRGSRPNEFLQVAFAGGISRITITANVAGGSFTLDNAMDGASGEAVPEPRTGWLVVAGIVLTLVGSTRK